MNNNINNNSPGGGGIGAGPGAGGGGGGGVGGAPIIISHMPQQATLLMTGEGMSPYSPYSPSANTGFNSPNTTGFSATGGGGFGAGAGAHGNSMEMARGRSEGPAGSTNRGRSAQRGREDDSFRSGNSAGRLKPSTSGTGAAPSDHGPVASNDIMLGGSSNATSSSQSNSNSPSQNRQVFRKPSFKKKPAAVSGPLELQPPPPGALPIQQPATPDPAPSGLGLARSRSFGRSKSADGRKSARRREADKDNIFAIQTETPSEQDLLNARRPSQANAMIASTASLAAQPSASFDETRRPSQPNIAMIDSRRPSQPNLSVANIWDTRRPSQPNIAALARRPSRKDSSQTATESEGSSDMRRPSQPAINAPSHLIDSRRPSQPSNNNNIPLTDPSRSLNEIMQLIDQRFPSHGSADTSESWTPPQDMNKNSWGNSLEQPLTNTRPNINGWGDSLDRPMNNNGWGISLDQPLTLNSNNNNSLGRGGAAGRLGHNNDGDGSYRSSGGGGHSQDSPPPVLTTEQRRPSQPQLGPSNPSFDRPSWPPMPVHDIQGQFQQGRTSQGSNNVVMYDNNQRRPSFQDNNSATVSSLPRSGSPFGSYNSGAATSQPANNSNFNIMGSYESTYGNAAPRSGSPQNEYGAASSNFKFPAPSNQYQQQQPQPGSFYNSPYGGSPSQLAQSTGILKNRGGNNEYSSPSSSPMVAKTANAFPMQHPAYNNVPYPNGLPSPQQTHQYGVNMERRPSAESALAYMQAQQARASPNADFAPAGMSQSSFSYYRNKSPYRASPTPVDPSNNYPMPRKPQQQASVGPGMGGGEWNQGYQGPPRPAHNRRPSAGDVLHRNTSSNSVNSLHSDGSRPFDSSLAPPMPAPGSSRFYPQSQQNQQTYQAQYQPQQYQQQQQQQQQYQQPRQPSPLPPSQPGQYLGQNTERDNDDDATAVISAWVDNVQQQPVAAGPYDNYNFDQQQSQNSLEHDAPQSGTFQRKRSVRRPSAGGNGGGGGGAGGVENTGGSSGNGSLAASPKSRNPSQDGKGISPVLTSPSNITSSGHARRRSDGAAIVAAGKHYKDVLPGAPAKMRGFNEGDVLHTAPVMNEGLPMVSKSGGGETAGSSPLMGHQSNMKSLAPSKMAWVSSSRQSKFLTEKETKEAKEMLRQQEASSTGIDGAARQKADIKLKRTSSAGHLDSKYKQPTQQYNPFAPNPNEPPFNPMIPSVTQTPDDRATRFAERRRPSQKDALDALAAALQETMHELESEINESRSSKYQNSGRSSNRSSQSAPKRATETRGGGQSGYHSARQSVGMTKSQSAYPAMVSSSSQSAERLEHLLQSFDNGAKNISPAVSVMVPPPMPVTTTPVLSASLSSGVGANIHLGSSKPLPTSPSRPVSGNMVSPNVGGSPIKKRPDPEPFAGIPGIPMSKSRSREGRRPRPAKSVERMAPPNYNNNSSYSNVGLSPSSSSSASPTLDRKSLKVVPLPYTEVIDTTSGFKKSPTTPVSMRSSQPTDEFIGANYASSPSSNGGASLDQHPSSKSFVRTPLAAEAPLSVLRASSSAGDSLMVESTDKQDAVTTSAVPEAAAAASTTPAATAPAQSTTLGKQPVLPAMNTIYQSANNLISASSSFFFRSGSTVPDSSKTETPVPIEASSSTSTPATATATAAVPAAATTTTTETTNPDTASGPADASTAAAQPEGEALKEKKFLAGILSSVFGRKGSVDSRAESPALTAQLKERSGSSPASNAAVAAVVKNEDSTATTAAVAPVANSPTRVTAASGFGGESEVNVSAVVENQGDAEYSMHVSRKEAYQVEPATSSGQRARESWAISEASTEDGKRSVLENEGMAGRNGVPETKAGSVWVHNPVTSGSTFANLPPSKSKRF